MLEEYELKHGRQTTPGSHAGSGDDAQSAAPASVAEAKRHFADADTGQALEPSGAWAHEARLTAVELASLRHRVWQLEQDLQAEKRLAAELRAEVDRRQAQLNVSRQEADEGRRHITDLRQQVTELEEIRIAASEDWRRGQHERALLGQQIDAAAETLEEHRQGLAEEHVREAECLRADMLRLQQEVQAMQRNPYSAPPVAPPSLIGVRLESRRGALHFRCPSDRVARPPEVGTVGRQCRLCQYFYFPDGEQPETGVKCRQCHYYYFSPDGSASPEVVNTSGEGADLGRDVSPPRSAASGRCTGLDAAERAAAVAAATRARLEVSALELELHEQEAARARGVEEVEAAAEAEACLRRLTPSRLR